jgi:hypothetical protein
MATEIAKQNKERGGKFAILEIEKQRRDKLMVLKTARESKGLVMKRFAKWLRKLTRRKRKLRERN